MGSIDGNYSTPGQLEKLMATKRISSDLKNKQNFYYNCKRHKMVKTNILGNYIMNTSDNKIHEIKLHITEHTMNIIYLALEE